MANNLRVLTVALCVGGTTGAFLLAGCAGCKGDKLEKTAPSEQIAPGAPKKEVVMSEAPVTTFKIDVIKAPSVDAPKPTRGQKVAVHYTGKLTSGVKFDSSLDRGEPIVFAVGVGQVIRGWDEGILQMQKGGKYVLTIAPSYGYGARGAGNVIPPNATLIFEMEIVDIK